MAGRGARGTIPCVVWTEASGRENGRAQRQERSWWPSQEVCRVCGCTGSSRDRQGDRGGRAALQGERTDTDRTQGCGSIILNKMTGPGSSFVFPCLALGFAGNCWGPAVPRGHLRVSATCSRLLGFAASSCLIHRVQGISGLGFRPQHRSGKAWGPLPRFPIRTH